MLFADFGGFYTPEYRFKAGLKNRIIDLYLRALGAPYLTKRVEYREALPDIAPRKEDRVLDVGVGDCLVALNLAPKVAEYHGIDVSTTDLARAYEKIRLYNRARSTGAAAVTNIFLVAGDVQDGLPYPSDSFDKVISFSVLEHIPDDERVFREMVRVARPGGTIVVVVPSAWEDQVRYRLMFRMVAWPVWLKRLVGGSSALVRARSLTELCDDLMRRFAHARVGYSVADFETRLSNDLTELLRVHKTIGFFGLLATDISNSLAAFELHKVDRGLGYEAKHDWVYALWYALALPFLWVDHFLTVPGAVAGWVITLRKRAA